MDSILAVSPFQVRRVCENCFGIIILYMFYLSGWCLHNCKKLYWWLYFCFLLCKKSCPSRCMWMYAYCVYAKMLFRMANIVSVVTPSEFQAFIFEQPPFHKKCLVFWNKVHFVQNSTSSKSLFGKSFRICEGMALAQMT